jgi:hypothetical protein
MRWPAAIDFAEDLDRSAGQKRDEIFEPTSQMSIRRKITGDRELHLRQMTFLAPARSTAQHLHFFGRPVSE